MEGGDLGIFELRYFWVDGNWIWKKIENEVGDW